MNALFIVNSTKDTDAIIGKEVIGFLLENNFKVYVEDKNYLIDGCLMVADEDLEKMDVSIILGGDGTIINYARRYAKYAIPFLGINLGRVGALAYAELSDYKDYILNITKSKYRIENRSVLDISIYFENGDSKSIVAYNDMSLRRGASRKILGVTAKINDSPENKFYCDGVVISTPTGSSAYNLSCGGPLLLPSTKCFVLTPISPQFKAFSPVVYDDEEIITLMLSDASETALLEIDGCESYEIKPLDRVLIRKGKHSLRMLCFDKPGALFGSLYKVAMSINKK
ncbi:MAG: NAD(+)/NADH kinase [Erysipelotrichaceae bacterium]|nr:NAD(+)/NADH kinase [Erysipelotrichaceae bacterium]